MRIWMLPMTFIAKFHTAVLAVKIWLMVWDSSGTVTAVGAQGWRFYQRRCHNSYYNKAEVFARIENGNCAQYD
jgi:hypothetical protein